MCSDMQTMQTFVYQDRDYESAHNEDALSTQGPFEQERNCGVLPLKCISI